MLRRHSSPLRKAVTTALGAVGVLAAAVLPPTSAHAAPTATLGVAVLAVPATVPSGADMVFRISWQCSSTTVPCAGAKLDVPLPTSNPDGIGIAIGTSSATTSTGGYTSAPTIDAAGAHWTFIDPLPAGSSGQMNLVLKPGPTPTQPGGMSDNPPDGSTYTPVATFSATNATSVTAQDTVTLTASSSVFVDKKRLGQTAQDPDPYTDSEPYMSPGGVDVTYVIRGGSVVGSERTPGTTQIQDVVVRDTIPAGATFVSATAGGALIPGTNIVEWPSWGSDGSGQPPTAHENPGYPWLATYEIVVHYPPSFPADNNRTDPSDWVTNTATITAHPLFRPNGPDLTATDDSIHGFRTERGSPGNIQKQGWPQYLSSEDITVQAPPGGGTNYVISLQNTSGAISTWEWDDVMPCNYTSPGTPCSDPDWSVTAIYNGINAPFTFTFTGTAGSTATVVIPSGGQVAPSLPGGERVASMHVSATLRPGDSGSLNMYGAFSANLDASPTTDPTYVRDDLPRPSHPDQAEVENCLTNLTADDGSGAAPFAVSDEFRCGWTIVREPARGAWGEKYMTPGTAGAGDLFQVEGILRHSGDLPLSPLWGDLLPAQLQYEPGSFTFDPALEPMEVEVVPDYNGTGRDLVRVTSVDGVDVEPGSGTMAHFWFKTRVRQNAIAGPAQNCSNTLDGKNRAIPLVPDYGTPGPDYPDVNDVDGDGDTAETTSGSCALFNITTAAGVDVAKSVMGDNDTSFQAPPAVGTISPGGTAQYKLHIANSGNIAIDHVVAYDVLPHAGDTGVILSTPRDTEWKPGLAGAIAPPPGGTVEYSVAAIPCRGEVMSTGGTRASGPAGCTDDWTATLPADPSTVTAIRIDFGDTSFAPGDARDVIFDVNAPPAADGTAWNTAAVAAQRVDDDSYLLPTESPKVGLIVPVDVELTKDIETPGPYDPLQEITYEVVVLNKGPGSASGVEVKDVLPAGMTYVSSTADQGAYDPATSTWTVGDIAVGDSHTLHMVVTVPNRAGQIINRAQVDVMNEPDIDSEPGNCDGPTPAEDDCEEVPIEIQPPDPDIDITKYTNTKDANEPPGPYVAVDGQVRWTYVVKNTGNVFLTNVTVTDDKIPGTDIDCGGGSNVVPRLEVGGTFTCIANGTAVVGQYENMGTVVGTPPPLVDEDGEPVPVPDVTDEDPSHYYAATPSVSIVKSTNGEDADEPPGPSIPAGGKVTWTYFVTNTGDTVLTDVTVTDDKVAASAISCPDDGNTDNVIASLAIGESATCTATGIAIGGPYENDSFVVGTPPPTTDVTGDPVETPKVTDENPSHYTGTPAGTGEIDLVKDVCKAPDLDRCDPLDDSVWVQSTERPADSEAVFRLTVANTGTGPLTDVIVDDPMPAGLTFVSGSASASRGDVSGFPPRWTIGDLIAGDSEVMVFRVRVGGPGTRALNVATTTGTDQNGTPHTDQDTAEVHTPPEQTLPITGSDVIRWARVGAVLLVAGLAILGVRRRTTRLGRLQV